MLKKTCQAKCRNDTDCLNKALPESDYCWIHERKENNKNR